MVRCLLVVSGALAVLALAVSTASAGQHQSDGDLSTLRSAALTEDIKVLSRVTPAYPAQARDEGVEGWVIVGATVDAAGNAYNYRVIESSPTGYFESAALSAFQRWRFSPAVENGEPVAAECRVKINFNLE